MNKFYVITNHDKDSDLELTNLICRYLLENNCTCTYRDGYAVKELVPKDCECAIVLGGDGTLVQAARELCNLNIPVLGVNVGTLGYLTEINKDQIIPALNMLIEDKYFVDNRMMLHGKVVRDNEVVYSDIAINDIVLNRIGSLQIISFDINVNGEYLTTYPADGLIVSTPTGSTAYNLSAGGPIVKPQTDIMVVTPICPHVLNKSSLIFDGNDVLEIVLKPSRNGEEERVVSFDGANYYNLVSGDRIVISKSEYTAQFLHTGRHNFLQILRNKMS